MLVLVDFLMKLIQILQDAASQPESKALLQLSELQCAALNVGDDDKHVLKSDKMDMNGLGNE